MNGPWDVRSVCTPHCAGHVVPRVPARETARRTAAFAAAVRRVLTDGDRLADPVRLRAHARTLLSALGIQAEGIDALPAAGAGAGGPGTLTVLNHISWLDIVTLLAAEPTTLLAKREVGRWPVVGGLARRAGTHFIDRTSPRRLPRTVRELSELLAAGRSVAVFPQATTWCTADRGAFRRATFQAALDAGAPIRPLTVSYTQQGRPSTVAAFCGDDTLAASLGRVLTARALTVRLTAHPALPTAGTALDRRELAARAEHIVLRGGPVRPAPAAIRPPRTAPEAPPPTAGPPVRQHA
ncbi:lysophospholipid acyltransferase family protein [Streptomyces sp. CT34]|uniref:lysophospholipid acyltransferase family protein n=1 Tax=Streptomyces sp. CT34 TaxID=1553907 RepID=UPI00068A41FB|nr:lysophospholipid acyltransferase family protein [Streptomyces sp. CT34]